jgi:hypothetical protein
MTTFMAIRHARVEAEEPRVDRRGRRALDWRGASMKSFSGRTAQAREPY